MDALSFVLGLRASVLRGGSLKDLIYHMEGKEPAAKKGAFVRMVFHDGGKELNFTRSIAASGRGEYKLEVRFPAPLRCGAQWRVRLID
jgi:chromosome segregation ATPase